MIEASNKEIAAELKLRGMTVVSIEQLKQMQAQMETTLKFLRGESKDSHEALISATRIKQAFEDVS